MICEMAGKHTCPVRPMRDADVSAAVVVAEEAFGTRAGDESSARRASARIRHLLRTDPGGAFVAERDERVVGVALALLREGLWYLSLLTVLSSEQGAGAGGALFHKALAYGQRSDTGMITSSEDPRAQALYARAGFDLRATVQAEGTLDRARLPAPHPGVRTLAASELEALAAVSRALRGASHTTDLQFAQAHGSLVLGLEDRGLAVVLPGRGVMMLAARDEPAAQALLWHALEAAGETDEPLVRWITAQQIWAIPVARRAGLRLTPYGALAVRGRPGPLRPYLPWGSFG